MDTTKILAELRAERERIDRAIAAVQELESRLPQTSTARIRANKQPAELQNGTSTPRKLSAGARRRMAEAAKRRWAAQKSEDTRSQATVKHARPEQVGPKRRMTAAGRKRISEMMKKRWAERKKGAPRAA